ncbi:MAG: class I SAM-dependent methyltransferase [Anaerolineales bacterium]|jgi:demethylmenaquinone methyltransferase/2-methoxy-6-polyprenyl-1,4-benzoquinol methylase
MSQFPHRPQSGFVRQLFARIAPRYDLLNRLMTFGLDLRWRRDAVRKLPLRRTSCVLDVGAGTGDLCLEILRREPRATVVALDFTPEMIALGRAHTDPKRVFWVLADAHHLPFPARLFDGIGSGFLFRNLSDPVRALEEQKRVLLQDGAIVSIDAVASTGGRRPLLVEAYFRWIIPLLGRLVAGDAEAYNYLPASMEAFITAEEFAEHMRQVGFTKVRFLPRMFATIAIHWGRKPNDHP